MDEKGIEEEEKVLRETIKRSIQDGKNLYALPEAKIILKSNPGKGDCMMYVLADLFELDHTERVVKHFRSSLQEALRNWMTVDNLINYQYSTLVGMLEPEDQLLIDKTKDDKGQWNDYVDRVIPTSGAWGNELLWTAWLRNPQNSYIENGKYSLNCFMIDRLSPIAEGVNLSTPICFAQGERTDPFRLWFVVIRTTTTEGNNGKGYGGTHYVIAKLTDLKTPLPLPLPSFEYVYTTQQILTHFRGYLQDIQKYTHDRAPCLDFF